MCKFSELPTDNAIVLSYYSGDTLLEKIMSPISFEDDVDGDTMLYSEHAYRPYFEPEYKLSKFNFMYETDLAEYSWRYATEEESRLVTNIEAE